MHTQFAYGLPLTKHEELDSLFTIRTRLIVESINHGSPKEIKFLKFLKTNRHDELN